MKRQLWIPLFGLLWAALACNLPPPPNALQVSANDATTTPAPTIQPSLPQGTTAHITFTPSSILITPSATLIPILHCKVNTTALNVRTCAGLTCTPVAWLHAGETVTITSVVQVSNDWLEVVVGDAKDGKLTGYIKATHCEVLP